MCFSTRNRILVFMDWVKVKVFGRDVSRSDTIALHSLPPLFDVRPNLSWDTGNKQIPHDLGDASGVSES